MVSTSNSDRRTESRPPNVAQPRFSAFVLREPLVSIRVKVPCLIKRVFFNIFPLNFLGSSAVVGADGVFLGVGFAAGTRSIARCTRTLLPSCVEARKATKRAQSSPGAGKKTGRKE